MFLVHMNYFHILVKYSQNTYNPRKYNMIDKMK